MTDKFKTWAVLLSSLSLCSPALGAGSGYPEYMLNFEEPFHYDAEDFPAGNYSAVIVSPTLFQRNHLLYILKDAPANPTDVEQSTLAEFPLLCASRAVSGTQGQRQKISLENGYFIIALQFPDHSDEIKLTTCVALVEARM